VTVGERLANWHAGAPFVAHFARGAAAGPRHSAAAAGVDVAAPAAALVVPPARVAAFPALGSARLVRRVRALRARGSARGKPCDDENGAENPSDPSHEYLRLQGSNACVMPMRGALARCHFPGCTHGLDLRPGNADHIARGSIATTTAQRATGLNARARRTISRAPSGSSESTWMT
jgi:hypothetical protein